VPAPQEEADVTSACFTYPKPLPFKFGIGMVTLAELTSTPATRAVIERHLPMLVPLVKPPMLHVFGDALIPQLNVVFANEITPAVLAQIDAELAQIPPAECPNLDAAEGSKL